MGKGAFEPVPRLVLLIFFLLSRCRIRQYTLQSLHNCTGTVGTQHVSITRAQHLAVGFALLVERSSPTLHRKGTKFLVFHVGYLADW